MTLRDPTGDEITIHTVESTGDMEWRLTFDALAEAGTYALFVEADVADEIGNLLGSSRSLPYGQQYSDDFDFYMPDLHPTFFAPLQNSVNVGATIALDWTVENADTVAPALAPWTDRAWISVDDVFGDDDDELLVFDPAGQVIGDDLQPGDQYAGDSFVTLPTGSDEVPGLEDDRLKGRLVNCPDCGDEFAYYYY